MRNELNGGASGWRIVATIHKYHGRSPAEIVAGIEADETLVVEGNMRLNDGITALLSLITGGGSYPALNNANARIKVGDGNAPAAAEQTDLQGAQTAEAAMEAGFPSIVGDTIIFKASFGPAVANFPWREYGIKNGPGAISSTVKLINRKVDETIGTKSAGATWQITVEYSPFQIEA